MARAILGKARAAAGGMIRVHLQDELLNTNSVQLTHFETRSAAVDWVALVREEPPIGRA